MVTNWIEKPLSELFDFSGGLSASRADLSTIGHPYLHYGDIHGSTSTFVDVCTDGSIPRLNVDLTKVSKVSLLSDGDVVFVDASEDDEGASRHLVVRNEKNAPFISGLHTIVAKAKTNELDNLFREFCFQTTAIKAQFKFYAVGTKVTGISKTAIGKILLSYPQDTAEQRRIAATLSDTDALITALEQLITKKCAIKQGAMQELLTGKRRLPGFSGEWVEKKLGEVVEVYDNLRIPVAESLREEGSTPYYGANGIQDYVKGYTHDGEFVLLAEDGANDLLNYPVQYVSGKVWVNNHAHVIKGISGVAITRFLGYALKVVDFQSVLVGGTRAKLNGSVMRDIDMAIPKDTDEQTAIAEILSDMDAEIDKLTARLNKLRGIKQGMMSELLTGRIRLAEQDATVEVVEEIAPITQTAPKGHNQQFDDAVMIAGIVNVLYSDRFPLGRKKVQKCLYLLRRYQDESTVAFKKKAAGPYADEVRYKGGEPIAKSSKYITTTTAKKGTTFACGDKINQALGYIESWDRQADIQWVADNLRFKKVDDLELLATVDMAICDLTEAGTPVTVQSIKHLIATNAEWKAKLKKQIFSDKNIARAMQELQTLLQGGKTNG